MKRHSFILFFLSIFFAVQSFQSHSLALQPDEFDDVFDEEKKTAKPKAAPKPKKKVAAAPKPKPKQEALKTPASQRGAGAQGHASVAASTAAPKPVVHSQAQAQKPVAKTQAKTHTQKPAAAPVAKEAVVVAAAPRRDPERIERLHNTFWGPTGGVHIVDARTGAAGSFRLQFAAEYFKAKSFLNQGDTNERIGATLSLSAGLWDFLEAFAALKTTSNSNDSENPNLFQVIGDTTLGLKTSTEAMDGFTVGADAYVMLLNDVGDVGVGWEGTSGGLGANATADVRRWSDGIPLLVRANVEYFLDNSAKLVEATEDRRFEALPDPADNRSDEGRHLVSRVERFALGINRVDRLNLGFGVEAPLEVSKEWWVNPIVEWRLSLPINRQGYDCLFVPAADDPNRSAAGVDSCVAREGFASYPQTLTAGVRVLPPVRGLAMLAAADIGLGGTNVFVRELTPVPPYNIIAALSYAYDTEPAPVVTAHTHAAARAQIEGRIVGVVMDREANLPVPDVVVRFPGKTLTALYADAHGQFTTYSFEPGAVSMELSHPDYQPGVCFAKITEKGGDESVRCDLMALPKMGTLEIKVLDNTGTTVSNAKVHVTGAATYEGATDAQGLYVVSNVPPGHYDVKVETEQHLLQAQVLDLAPRAKVTQTFTLTPRPSKASVEVKANEIVLKKKINFATNSAEIVASSFPLLKEIADAILRNPDIRRVEIQGHTDNRGGKDRNMSLSQERADAVMQWLISAGVSPDKLNAQGYGQNKPIFPNITSAARAKNRRVQFMILK